MDKIKLPGSKSVALRVLTMNAVSQYCGGGGARIVGECDAEDVGGMLRALAALQTDADEVYIGEGGAPLRFFTALAASLDRSTVGNILTGEQENGFLTVRGSERLNNRPMGILIDALREMGGRIECPEKEGCSPVRISGRQLSGGVVEIDAGVSSQYLSALMMVSPLWREGLTLRLKGGESVSQSYLTMTEKIMEMYGVKTQHKNGEIIVDHSRPCAPESIRIEADWSAASYFYEMAVLQPGRPVEIASLTPAWESLQGDAACARIFKALGVATTWHEDGSATIVCDPALPEMMRSMYSKGECLRINLSSTPDLVPALCVAFSLAGMPFRFSGVAHLRIKESDRIAALTAEMRKLGYLIGSDEESMWWSGERCEAEKAPVIATYNDHRMAMAFAPAVVRYPALTIESPEVVGKSFPAFFTELRKLIL